MPFSARKWAAGAGTPGQGCSTVCSRGGGRPAPRRGVLPFPSGVRSESMGSNLIWRLLMTTDLLTCLATIPDRRRAEGKMYGQAGVILFSILAMVSGARSYRQIHTLMDRRLGLLNAAFPGAALRRGPAYTSGRGRLPGGGQGQLKKGVRPPAAGA